MNVNINDRIDRVIVTVAVVAAAAAGDSNNVNGSESRCSGSTTFKNKSIEWAEWQQKPNRYIFVVVVVAAKALDIISHEPAHNNR